VRYVLFVCNHNAGRRETRDCLRSEGCAALDRALA
jgi:hypothetical protein